MFRDDHPAHSTPLQPSRRSFLRYVGAGASALAATNLLGPLAGCAGVNGSSAGQARGAWADARGVAAWRPVGYPLPIPGDGGSAATDAARLATYEVRDALQLPPGFRYDVVAAWGDVFGPANDPSKQIRFGFNADYTGLVPVSGAPGEYWLIVNHEYISARPWLQGFTAVHGQRLLDAKLRLAGVPVNGIQLDAARIPTPALRDAVRRLCTAAMSDLGVSVLRVRRDDATGRFAVVKDSPDHFRFSGAGAQNVPDAENKMRFTGPAAPLLGRPRGTFGNCSGATTPWGTFLTCEENFQDQVPEFVTPAGEPLPGRANRKRFWGRDEASAVDTGLPFEFEGLGTGLEQPLDGRQYGWVCEVDPVRRTLTKHTALGRFRHENVALRAEAGQRLAAYMGDDRRGGHVWKFVSRDVVKDPTDPTNSKLLEDGRLYVARFTADGFKGEWVPLEQGTPVRKPAVEHFVSGHAWLPSRPVGGHVAVGLEQADDDPRLAPDEWARQAAEFGKRPFEKLVLADLVFPLDPAHDAQRPYAQGQIVLDAFAMANAVGGTPCARPEDVEVHPADGSVYVAFTDSTGSGEGSPDVRIFPDSRGKNSRQYGAIYRLAEDGNDPAATTFTWGRFVSSGEMTDGGGGFAAADNLAFDPAHNLWMVCDITTPAHNHPVDRTSAEKTRPGEKNFLGVFGNNALFMIPTAGDRAGLPHCFGIGPMDAELTGPTFTPDGRSLLVSVQHPGELNGARGLLEGQPTQQTRTMSLVTRDNAPFAQQRVVPLGSNFPGGKPGDTPKPCVVCITRDDARA